GEWRPALPRHARARAIASLIAEARQAHRSVDARTVHVRDAPEETVGVEVADVGLAAEPLPVEAHGEHERVRITLHHRVRRGVIGCGDRHAAGGSRDLHELLVAGPYGTDDGTDVAVRHGA